jgi:hypothetical protein
MTICLSELNELLFPECYLFRTDHLLDELKILKEPRINDREVLNAIAFKVRVTRLSMKIRQPEMRQTIQYIYEDFMGRIYDWYQPYNWRNLKLVLLFFVLFWDAKCIDELEARVRSPFTIQLLKHYKPMI